MTFAVLVLSLLIAAAPDGGGQQNAGAVPSRDVTQAAQPPRGRAAVQVDDQRARRLDVSNKPSDHATNYDFDGDIRTRTQAEARCAEASRGVMDYVEDQQIVDALRSRQPDLAEPRVYVNPTPGPVSVGHTVNRRTNVKTLERDDSPEQRDSWNRVWTFFEWSLRPYDERPRPAGSTDAAR